MEQRYSKTSKANADEDLSDDEDKSSDEDSDHEPLDNTNEVEQVVETPVAPNGRRKGRRAVSTGVISTN